MTRWHENAGKPPVLPGDDAPIVRVFVRLRNGMTPVDSWPSATGRHPTTRWSLTGHPFDITQWRPA